MTATPAQRNFADTLIRERDVPAETVEMINRLFADPDASPRRGGPISEVIDGLLRRPRRAARAAAAAPAAHGAVFAAIDALEVSKYAIPAVDLPAALMPVVAGNDHLFVEVREYRGRKYLRRLHGAPGSFSRSKLPLAVTGDIAAVLTGHTLRYSQKFGELYTCCGVCGAELTDETSRALKLGPVCRQRWGL